MTFKARIAVFGGRDAPDDLLHQALELGRGLARENWLVFCGGGEGVMRAVSQGIREQQGTCIGILKGLDRREANPFVTIPILTGMNIGRNVLLAYNCDVAVAIGGKYGTLSEIAYALQLKKPVVGLGTWDFPEITKAASPEDALQKIKERLP